MTNSTILEPPYTDNCCCDRPVLLFLSSHWNQRTHLGDVRAIQCGYCYRPVNAELPNHPDHNLLMRSRKSGPA
jgi:hypothetical protein